MTTHGEAAGQCPHQVLLPSGLLVARAGHVTMLLQSRAHKLRGVHRSYTPPPDTLCNLLLALAQFLSASGKGQNTLKAQNVGATR